MGRDSREETVGRGHNDHHTVHEFGEVRVGGLATEAASPGAAVAEPPALHGVVLLRRRYLRQYFEGDTLVREVSERKVSYDELFLDLIMVASLATLNHELRADVTWLSLGRFVTGFGSLWIIWRDVGFQWNLWGSYGDLLDWAIVLVLMSCMMLIAIGYTLDVAYTRIVVPTCAMIAHFFLALLSLYFGLNEPKFRVLSSQWKNQQVQTAIWSSVQALIYVPATIVTGEKAVDWVLGSAVCFGILRSLLMPTLGKFVLRPQFRIAYNIEVLVEKYGLLTIIVFGESILTMPLSAATIDYFKAAKLYGTVFLVIIAIQAFHGLYFKLDAKILFGGIHAIRRHFFTGVCWIMLHFPLHVGLAVGAGGAGNLLVLSADGSSAGHMAIVHAGAGDSGADSYSEEQADWWMLCGGWGSALIFSAALAICHKKSPGAHSKPFRLAGRMAMGLFIITLPLYLAKHLDEIRIIALISGLILLDFLVEFMTAYFVDHQVAKAIMHESSLADFTKVMHDDESNTAELERQASLAPSRKQTMGFKDTYNFLGDHSRFKSTKFDAKQATMY